MLSLFSRYRFSLAVDYINEGFTTEMLFRSFPILTYYKIHVRNAFKQWHQNTLRHVIRPSFMYVHVYPGSDTFHRHRINRKLTVEFEGLERFPQSLIWSYSILITPITHIRVWLMAFYITRQKKQPIIRLYDNEGKSQIQSNHLNSGNSSLTNDQIKTTSTK